MGRTGAMAGCVPSSTTSGWYIVIALVAGSMIAASTNADWSALASLHGPAAGSVAFSRYGVARPAAEVGFGGTVIVQLRFGLVGGGAPAVAVVGVVPGEVGVTDVLGAVLVGPGGKAVRPAATALRGVTSCAAVNATSVSTADMIRGRSR